MKPLTAIASRILSSFKSRNQRRLRKLNDEVLKAASMDFTKVSFDLAVYSYILSKIVSKPRFLDPACEGYLSHIEEVFGRLVNRLDSADDEELMAIIGDLDKAIARLEDKDPRFVIDLVTKGKLKMAATLYAQGMSLGVAAEMTGLNKQEILDYAGETMMFDRLKEEMSVSERMKNARKLLNS